VVLEINPAVEMVLNENNEVEYVNSLNEDGDVLLSEINLEGMDVDEAIDEIIEESTDLGFIDPNAEETVVDVTTVTEDEEADEELGEKIKKHVDDAFVERGMHGYSQMKKMTQDIIIEAETLGISAGKLRLIKQAQELDPDLTLEAAIAMKVSELTHLVKENGNQNKEMVKALRDEFFAQRDLIVEEYRPQVEALQTAIADLRTQLEAATDETVKTTLQAELDAKVAELEALLKTRNDEIKVLRDSFKDQITAKKAEVKAANKARVEEHKAEVDAFKQNFQKNKEKIQKEIENWKKGKKGN
jgi:hypothetical protein